MITTRTTQNFCSGISPSRLPLFHQGDGGGAADFLRCRDKLPARPWFVDDFTAIKQRFADNTLAPYRKGILFVGAHA